MPLDTYLLYLAAVAVFFASPPDTSQLLTLSNSVRYGLRRAHFTIAGDLTANGLQMTAAAFGLAAVIATSATAFAQAWTVAHRPTATPSRHSRDTATFPPRSPGRRSPTGAACPRSPVGR